METETQQGWGLREYLIVLRHFSGRLKRDFFGTGEGDASSPVTTTLALLAAYSVCVSAFLVMTSGFQLREATLESRIFAFLSAREFLTASTIAIAGVYFVFLWENLFPDRFDCHVLLSLPVSPWQILAAKLTAVLGFLGMLVATAQSFSLCVLPFLALTCGSSFLPLEFLAHLMANIGAMLLVFFGLAAVLASSILVLPYRVFQAVKPLLQFLTFTVFLGQMFFSPPLELILSNSGTALGTFASSWPSFWFVGMADWLTGGFVPLGGRLAATAIVATCIAIAAGVGAIVLAFPRAVRYAMEETEFASRRGSRFSLAELWLRPWLDDDPPALALGLYTMRVLLRDARSRAMFLLFAGLGAGYCLHEVAAFLQSASAGEATEPQVFLLPLPLVLVFLALVAIRTLCATPISLPASWVFRLFDWGDARRVRKAVRGVMAAMVVVPVCALCLAFHAWLWGTWLACTHTVFLLMMALIVMEWTLRSIDTIPFTRPRPEQLGRLRVMFGIYVLLFVTFTFFVAHLEYWLLGSPVAFLGFLLVTLGIWLWLRARNNSKHQPPVRAFGEMDELLIRLQLDV